MGGVGAALMVRVKLAVLVLPAGSVAVQAMVVVPAVRVLPDAGVQSMAAVPELSVAVGAV